MTSPTIPAGWYPAPHADDELRYWDGAAWAEPGPQSAPRFFARPISRKVGAIASGSALVVGLLLGAGMGSAGSGSELENLESRVELLEVEKMEAVSAVEEIEGEARLSEDMVAEVELQLSGIEAELQSVQDDVASRDTQLAERDARLAELEAELAAQGAPAPVPVAPAPVTPPAPPASVYYENCTAARNAGATPVYAGQPGYGKHLDRDGDGVGCE